MPENGLTWKSLFERSIRICKRKLYINGEKIAAFTAGIIAILAIFAAIAIVLIPGVSEKIIGFSLSIIGLVLYTIIVLILLVLKICITALIGLLALLYIILAACFIALIIAAIGYFFCEGLSVFKS